MNRFCTECGQQAHEQDIICTNCGNRLPEMKQAVEPQPKQTQPKKPLNKKQKTIYILSGAFLIILIACYLFTSNYFSEKSVIERFNEGLANKDADQLASLIVHEDGSSISLSEAEALLALNKEEGKEYLIDFLKAKETNKFLGIITRYKIFAANQYAYFDGSTKGMTFSFNKTKISGEKEDEKVVFGPFAPGIYTVDIELDNEFGKNSTKIKDFYLDENDEVRIDAEVSEAVISIEGFNENLMSDAYVLINDEKKIAIKDGESEKFGPLFLNGTATANVVVNYPWGEVKSKAYELEDSHSYISPSILTDKEVETISSTLLNFGEQFAKGRATKSTSDFDQITAHLKSDFLNEIINSYIEYDYFYTGQLNTMNIDENSIYAGYDDKIYLDVQYQYLEAPSYSIDETPEKMSMDYDWTIGLKYDKKTKSWLIDSIEALWGSVSGTKTIKGSQKLYTPDEKVVKSQKDKTVKVELQEFMSRYYSMYVNALNARDIYYIEDYYAPGAPAKEETEDYYKHVEKNEITELFLGTEVTDVKDIGDNTYEVTSIDRYTIDIDGEESDASFKTVSIVKKINDEWKFYKLKSTDEIK